MGKHYMTMSIAQASTFLGELLNVLENLYWESSSLNMKNQCFNGVRLVQQEITELTKVSVQDHHYDYEIIACPEPVMAEVLSQLETLSQEETLRTCTAAQLKPLLEQGKAVFK